MNQRIVEVLLKRVLIGEDQIQGVDYTYNLQGWLKAINHVACDPKAATFLDPGNDKGMAYGNGTNTVAPDAFGMMLHYYNGDSDNHHGDFYKLSSPFNADNGNLYQLYDNNPLHPDQGSLYNGNISGWSSYTTPIPGTSTQTGLMHQGITGEIYRYDELNRIKSSNFNMWNVNSTHTQHYDLLTNTFADAFATSYRYDGNGNILELNRKDHFGTGMDILSYTYQAGTNKLTHIDDQIANNAIAGVSDLTDQDPNNYTYDAIGNLTQDAKEEKQYQWTPYGKLRNVAPSTATATNQGYLDFKYDGTGNRVYKKYSAPPVAANQSPLFPTVETFYLRDAQGNVLATYERTGDKNNGVVLVQKEIHLYGSDRLGIRLRELETPEDPTGTGGTGGNNGDPDPSGSASGQRKMVIEEVMYDSKLSTELGIEEKHLGEYLILKNVWNSAVNLGTFRLKNVETNQFVYFDSVEVDSGQRVIVAYGEGDFTDKAQFVLATHFPESRLEDESLIWHWQTDMVLGDDAATIQLFETNTQKDELRYGSDFGKLAENDSTQDSVYVLKREGYEKGQNTSDYPEYAKQAKDWEQQGDIALIKGDYVLRELHLKRYELKDHLGNVRVIVADVKDATLGLQGQPREFAAILKHYSHYYPFGMEKPSMVYDKGGYRYGFNGKENDDEVKGVANSVDFGARIYDSRAARWLSLDPMASERVAFTPYNAMSCSPISRNDPTGALDDWVSHDGKMEYDSRVKSQDDAVRLYGENAKYIAPNTREASYTANTGENIVLGENGNFTSNGVSSISPDIAPPSEGGVLHLLSKGRGSAIFSLPNSINRLAYASATISLYSKYGGDRFSQAGADARLNYKTISRNATLGPTRDVLNKVAEIAPKALPASHWKTDKWVNGASAFGVALGAYGAYTTVNNILEAENKPKQAFIEAGGWGGAWLGAKAATPLAIWVAPFTGPVGPVIVIGLGAAGGSILGIMAAEQIADPIFDTK